MLPFNPMTESNALNFIQKRVGETKLGECCAFADGDLVASLTDSEARFVVLGIPEDIGPRANGGKGGAQHAWRAFLYKFLNIQSNVFLKGSEILVAGNVETADLCLKAEQLNFDNPKDLSAAYELVSELDNRVTTVLEIVLASGKIPIVIGGGHNNAFGCLRAFSKHSKTKINVLNIDPHADLRREEGRHSGNGFTYAKAQGYLGKYAVVGLHESYNSSYLIEAIQKDSDLFFNTWDSFVSEKTTFEDLINEGLSFVSKAPFGFEFDMDALANMPSSAMGPSGLTLDQARLAVSMVAKKSPHYLHLPEAAPLTTEEANRVGKALAYLVSDFVKCYL